MSNACSEAIRFGVAVSNPSSRLRPMEFIPPDWFHHQP